MVQSQISVARPSEWNRWISPSMGGFVIASGASQQVRADLREQVFGDVRMFDLATSVLSARHRELPVGEPRPCLGTVVSGESSLSHGNLEIQARAGDVVFHSGNITGPFEASDDFRVVGVSLPRWTVPMPDSYFGNEAIIRLGPERELVGVVHALLNGLSSEMSRLSDVAGSRALWSAVELAMNALGLARFQRGRAEERLSRIATVKTYIEQHLGDPDLSVDRIARAHFVSTRSLQAWFAQDGETVASWIRTRRLDRARRALRDPAQVAASVAELSRVCGFSSPSYFGRVFAEAHGVTPGEFRSGPGSLVDSSLVTKVQPRR